MRTAITTIALIASLTLTAHGKYVTAKEGLRLRKSPSLEAEIIDVLPFATEVNGTISDGWMRVEDGYVSCQYLQDTNPLEECEYLGQWRVTAYAETGMPCADGTMPQIGETIACNSLTFGSVVFVRGVGLRTVHDLGPAWMGDEWLDLYLGDVDSCIEFGDQKKDVYLVSTP